MSKRLSFADDGKDGRPGVLKTSSSLDVPAGVTQEEGHTGFFIHLPSAGLMAGSASLGMAGLGWAKWASRLTGRTGWILLTTAVVTLVPLVFEVTREAQLIEQEKMQINALLAEGKTRHEIASMGLYSALDPNVMGPET